MAKIDTINALAELERLDWVFEPASDEEVRCKCPVHGDDTPSVQLNTKKNLWNCKASHCSAKGDIVTLLALIVGVERPAMLVDLGKRYDLEEAKTINTANVERHHTAIWEAGPLLQELRNRGVSDDLIRKARLGFYRGRIAIPIWDAHGNCVNIRYYLPGAPGPQKMKNTRGYGAPRIYQIDQLFKFDTIWICGGEMKALVVGGLLNPDKVGAIAVSAGEGAWNSAWTPLLEGKVVYICMDVDIAGRAAARQIGGMVHQKATETYVVTLPLDKKKHPKGDVNDYVGTEGAGADELKKMMETAAPFKFEGIGSAAVDSDEVTPVRLQFATDARHIGKRISFEAVVAAMDEIPFIVPRKVGVSCGRDQPNCAFCPVSTMEQNPDDASVAFELSPTSAGLLDMINAPTSKQFEGIKDSIGIPACKKVQVFIRGHYEVRDVRLTPQLSIGGESSSNILQPAYVVNHECEMNTPYNMVAVTYPHPKDQRAILLVSEAEQVEDNLTTFAPSDADIESLDVFKPTAWTVEGIQAKLDEIYADFEANVTGIFMRRDLHLMFDLTYHSVILFPFDRRQVTGWVNTIVVGDSSQGKSETSIRLMDHYGLGERVECKNASVAGLLGGLQQMGNRWFVSWGIIPTHDRRLVILEEVKGADTEVIGKLTDMRSSGIAEIQKIERRRAHARTRLCFISNPRSRRPITAFNFGIEAIKELIGSLEDVRRFDLANIASADQVDPAIINQSSTERPEVEHIFTSDVCRRLILYAWTRKEEDTEFQPEATKSVLKHTVAMCDKYSEVMPLIDRGTMRFKIARLAVSLAIRTASIEDGKVLVRKCHIDYIVQMIDRLYSDPIFGYEDFSRAQRQANVVLDPADVEKHIRGLKYPKDFVHQLLYRDELTVHDIEDWCELDQDESRRVLSFLVRKHAIYRKKRVYVKTSEFIQMLKRLESEDLPDEPEIGAGDEF